MNAEVKNFSLDQIDSVIERLQALKQNIKDLENLEKYAEKRLIIEMKKGSIISSITLI